jgi:serine/threonine-protein kinase RIM15
MTDQQPVPPLVPPVVTALKEAAVGESNTERVHMERSVSMDIREERADLKEAAEHSQNVIMDLDLQGNVKWVSSSWKQVIGTDSNDILGKPIGEFLPESTNVFADAVESMRKDDSRSIIIRFNFPVGPHSSLKPKSPVSISPPDSDEDPKTPTGLDRQYISLEAQGIMVYDRTSGKESHVSYL